MLARSESVPRTMEARVPYGLRVTKASKVLQRLALPLYNDSGVLSRAPFIGQRSS